MISLNKITKRFKVKSQNKRTTGTFTAVNEVNLNWKRGEFLSVVGESGCGKSTLARIIAGLIHPTDGTLSIDGNEVHVNSESQRKEWARKVQIVPQDPYAALNPVRKISSSLADPLLYHKIANKKNVTEKTVELLEHVGLSGKETLNKYPHQLSGGQRQRLVIGRALSVNPNYLIADESVSMMDVSLRVEILDYLKSLADNLNLGLMFITHDFRVARYISIKGKIAVMYLGNIVEYGSTTDILTRPMHPYTQSLISAIPLLKGLEQRVENVIPKTFEVKNLDENYKGCPFAQRCPFVEKECYKERPPLKKVSNNHHVACHFATARTMIATEEKTS
jgi:oligopeptide/dipeptide ABC transporter ATP-binding protein